MILKPLSLALLLCSAATLPAFAQDDTDVSSLDVTASANKAATATSFVLECPTRREAVIRMASVATQAAI